MVYRHFTEDVTSVRVYETRTSCADVDLEDFKELEEGGYVIVRTAFTDRDTDPGKLKAGGSGTGTKRRTSATAPQAARPVNATNTGDIRPDHSRRRTSRG
jgi:hypothetical protein